MSHHTYTKRDTSSGELFVLLAGMRMLRQKGVSPSAQAFEQVVNEGLLDGAPDVTLCNQTFTAKEVRSFIASNVKHFHDVRGNAYAEHDPVGAFEAALDCPCDIYLAVQATDRMAPDERQSALRKATDDQDERQSALRKATDDQDDWRTAIVSIELGLDVSTASPSGKPWLSTVIDLDKGQTWVAQALLDNGADPNGRDENGETPLHALAYGCEERLVNVLLDGGADPLIRDNVGRRPLDKVEGIDTDGTPTAWADDVQIDEDDYEVLRDATERAEERAALVQAADEAMNHHQPAPRARRRL